MKPGTGAGCLMSLSTDPHDSPTQPNPFLSDWETDTQRDLLAHSSSNPLCNEARDVVDMWL